jgi:hypothetical protein
MNWIVIGSFLCGGFAMFHGLYVAQTHLKRIEPTRGLAGELKTTVRELMQHLLQKKTKRWLIFAMAPMSALLLLHNYNIFLPIFVGAITTFLVGSLAATIDAAHASSTVDSEGPQGHYRSSVLSGHMVMGCGLMGLAGLRLLFPFWDSGAYGSIGILTVQFAMGTILMFLALRNSFLTRSGTLPHSETHQTVRRKPLGARAVHLYSWYTTAFACATFLIGTICDRDPSNANLPLLAGTVGLMACVAGDLLASSKPFEPLGRSKTLHLALGTSLALAGAGLYVAERHFQVWFLLDEYCLGTEAILFPVAFSGMMFTGLMVLTNDVLATKWPVRTEINETKPAVNHVATIRRAIRAICTTILPIALGFLAPLTGYYLLKGTHGTRLALEFGTVMSVMGMLAVSGMASKFDSDERFGLLEKFFGLPVAAAAFICLASEYTRALNSIASHKASAAAKPAASNLFIDVLAYTFVGIVVILLVYIIVEFIWEIVSRYRRMD